MHYHKQSQKYTESLWLSGDSHWLNGINWWIIVKSIEPNLAKLIDGTMLLMAQLKQWELLSSFPIFGSFQFHGLKFKWNDINRFMNTLQIDGIKNDSIFHLERLSWRCHELSFASSPIILGDSHPSIKSSQLITVQYDVVMVFAEQLFID